MLYIHQERQSCFRGADLFVLNGKMRLKLRSYTAKKKEVKKNADARMARHKERLEEITVRK